ncbi:MAG TPA: fumarate reductase/succinate dehydrogenase flavoprotein subunit, partial [Polyangia bacterium]|nr:fumarate reductase/succinate dehydrogenase flavoprotein subunit [Polyangia bacterium]
MNADQYKTHEYDVLVIGAGGAGLRAAIEAAATPGVSVGLVCKSLLGKAHTVMAEGGIAAALGNTDERDNWKVHFADTMRGGQYVNNWRMAELHAREAPDRVRELEAWGALFDRTKDGRILQRNFGGHKYPRLAHVGDRTGLEMIRTLQDHGIHQGIQVHMELTVVSLIKDGERVCGAFAYERERGYFHVFRAKAVVLATGGIGRAYKITSNSWECTGDGHTLAYDAGAELIDMEFVQFHPTGMVWPPSVRGILVTEGVRGEGGVLKNKEGRRFMFDDIPDNYKPQTADNEEEGWRYTQGDKTAKRPPELLTRDHVARCIVREIKAGRGSPHGGVFLDIAWIKSRVKNGEEHIKKKLPSMYHQFIKLANVDITKDPMEVGPTTHYVMGGIRVDADTQASTTVPGLFAAGECAAGINGANRLGGNSLSDLLVFGKRAGEYAAKYAKEQKAAGRIDEAQLDAAAKRALAPFEREGSADGPYQIQHALQDMMQELVGIVRVAEEMTRAVAGIAELRKKADVVGVKGNREYNPGWSTALDLHNLLTVSEAVARSALLRKESRGGHFRADAEKKSDEWGKKNIVLKKGSDGAMQITTAPIAEMP